MTKQRYHAYRSLLSELRRLHAAEQLGPTAHDELRDAAEGLLLARMGSEAEDSLTHASTTVLGLLALDDLDERRASWLLDALLACGPRVALDQAAA